MSDVLIRAEGLSKQYRLGEVLESQSAGNLLRNTWRRVRGISGNHECKASGQDFWALRDVSFELRSGETLGIFGRNGAGKSTLLKILARITPPTEGSAKLRGRLAALLEVGTGFHADFTGYENVYFIGSLYGLSRDEMKKRMEAIVDFAGIEKFMDSPVRFLSSGMYMRLAFAVAAHLDPEILLVDEVLAVGDAQFQKKCFEKMDEAGRSGRAVIFVSHNLSAIARLCPRALLLDGGRVSCDGPTDEVIRKYMQLELGTAPIRQWRSSEGRPGDQHCRLRSVAVCNDENEVCTSIDVTQSVSIRIEYEILRPGRPVVPVIRVVNDEGVLVFIARDNAEENVRRTVESSVFQSVARIPENMLNEGIFTVGVTLRSESPTTRHVLEDDVIAFSMADHVTANPTRGNHVGRIPGVVRPLIRWTCGKVDISNENSDL